MSYYTKITKAGLAAITAAMNNNSKVPITYMAFGDGNGYIPEPDENANSLVNEVYRTGVNKVEVHNKNPNWLLCEAIIPSAVGGFNIREIALYDSTGNTMLAIANYPPTYKPTVNEGAAKIQTIRIVIQVDNSGNFELIVDPDIVLATVKYVQNSLFDTNIRTASGRSQEEINNDILDIESFGGISNNQAENNTAWNTLSAGRQNFIASLAKGNYKITPPTTIDPNLRYSYYPPYGIAGLFHLQHGTESNPERTVGQITQVVRRVNDSTRNFAYEEQIGSALFDTKIKGTGDVNNPNLCGWVSGIFNIYKEAKCELGKLDQKGSVVGLTTFAGCDYLDEDRLVSGLWARAVSPKPSDAEYDQIVGTWHTVGAEINARIRHKDTGYRENMGKGTSAVLMLYNNIRPEDIATGSTVHARNNTFGLLFGGGKFSALENTIDNYNGYYTGIQLNYIKRVGIDFPNRAAPNAIGIRFAQNRVAGSSYKTAIDLGNNKLRFGDGSFSYDEADNGDIWYNAGTLYFKDSRYNAASSRFIVADSYVPKNAADPEVFTPTHFLKVRWNASIKFKIPAFLET